ncbi:MAG: hypothetical protein V4671_30870 [Armatimonadota bacterium]
MSETISLARVVTETGIHRSALNRFLDEPAIRRWLGGEASHPAYPKESLPAFVWLNEQYTRGIKPKALGLIVAPLPVGAVPEEGGGAGAVPVPDTQELVADRNPDSAILNPSSPQMTAAMDYLANALVSRVQEAKLLPAREDRFLSREQAAELLACEPGVVGRRVKPVSRETWSYLMIQDYMTDQREKAVEKARAAAEKRATKKDNPDTAARIEILNDLDNA